MTIIREELSRAESLGVNLIRESDLNIVRMYRDELNHGRIDEIPRCIRKNLRRVGVISRSRAAGAEKLTAYGLELLKESKRK